MELMCFVFQEMMKLILDDDADIEKMDDEEEIELDKIDLSVPEGASALKIRFVPNRVVTTIDTSTAA